jgi:hypothetical protein
LPVCASTSMTVYTWWPRWLYSNVKSAAVLPPLRRGDVVRIWKQGAININLLPGCNVEQDRDCNVQCVARLHIVKGTVLRLNLIGR